MARYGLRLISLCFAAACIFVAAKVKHPSLTPDDVHEIVEDAKERQYKNMKKRSLAQAGGVAGGDDAMVGWKEAEDDAGKDRAKRETPEYAGTPLLFTAEEMQNLVDLHNDYRRQVSPEAANMEYMVWDDQLAAWAQEWVDDCYYEHGFPAGADNVLIGQNLWRGNVHEVPDGSGPISSWWNENRYYTYQNKSCQDNQICGHYTQLVWGPSGKVGCGRTFCEDGHDDTLTFSNNYLFACNYDPIGNVLDEFPYDAGPNCTRCTSGKGDCDDALCRQCQPEETANECTTECKANCLNCGDLNADCTCTCRPQFVGADCSLPCGNFHENCGTGWPVFACNLATIPEFANVPVDCPLMCGLCTEDDGSFQCVQTTVPTTVKTTIHATIPTTVPTTVHTTVPTTIPTTEPTTVHTTVPTTIPTTEPTTVKTTIPTTIPTTVRTTVPTTVQTTSSTKPNIPSTEQSTSASCYLTSCQNEGTFDQASCTCECKADYQGDDCAVPKEQIVHAVVMTISSSIENWPQLLPIFLRIIAQVMTFYCNMQFSVCCPNSGTKTNPLQLDYVSSEHVFIVDGYPQSFRTPSRSIIVAATYVKPPLVTQLCEEGSATATQRRRRRGIDDLDTGMLAQTTPGAPQYFSQAALLDAILENIKDIENELNATVTDISLGEEETTPEECPAPLSTAWIVGICLLAIVPAAILIVALIILVMKSKHLRLNNFWVQRQIINKVNPDKDNFKN